MAKKSDLSVAVMPKQDVLFEVSVASEVPHRALIPKDLDEDVAQAVAQHTEAVFLHSRNAKVALAHICVHIYLCRQAFDRNVAQSSWGEYVRLNFEPLGLDERRVRMAVETGKGLLAGKANLDVLSTLSKAAFLALGSSPDVIDKVIEIAQARRETMGESSPPLSQADIQKIHNFDKLKARAEALDEELARKSRAASELQEINERLIRESKQPVEALVDVVPKGYKTLEDAITALRKEETIVKSQLNTVREELDAMKSKEQAAKNRISKMGQADDALAQLEADLSSMRTKYTAALVTKLRDSDPSVAKALKKVGAELHAMADTLEGLA